MIANRIVILTSDCVFTDRPGETDIIVEGARLEERHGDTIDMLTLPRALMPEVERALLAEPDCVVCGLLDVSDEHMLYVLVQPRGGWPVYTDGHSLYDTRTLLEVRSDTRIALPRAA